MFGRITRRGNQISAENRVDPADHLEIILAMATVPLPSRWPNEAEWINGEEDCADCNQSNLEELFARDLVHVNLLSANKNQLASLVAKLIAIDT
jgi:hypothetical protein